MEEFILVNSSIPRLSFRLETHAFPNPALPVQGHVRLLMLLFSHIATSKALFYLALSLESTNLYVGHTPQQKRLKQEAAPGGGQVFRLVAPTQTDLFSI